MLDPDATGFVWQAKLETMHRDLRELESACRAEGTPRIQDAIDNAVRWFQAVTPVTPQDTAPAAQLGIIASAPTSPPPPKPKR